MGRAGRAAVAERLPKLRQDWRLDFVVVNGENATTGAGLSPASCQACCSRPAPTCVTLGDHAFDQKDMLQFIETEPRILRPLNFAKAAPGAGARVFDAAGRAQGAGGAGAGAGVHEARPSTIRSRRSTPVLKAHPLGGQVQASARRHPLRGDVARRWRWATSATAAPASSSAPIPMCRPRDAQILPGGTAYLTDAGMCGDYNSRHRHGQGRADAPLRHRHGQGPLHPGRGRGDAVAASTSRPTTAPARATRVAMVRAGRAAARQAGMTVTPGRARERTLPRRPASLHRRGLGADPAADQDRRVGGLPAVRARLLAAGASAPASWAALTLLRGRRLPRIAPAPGALPRHRAGRARCCPTRAVLPRRRCTCRRGSCRSCIVLGADVRLPDRAGAGRSTASAARGSAGCCSGSAGVALIALPRGEPAGAGHGRSCCRSRWSRRSSTRSRATSSRAGARAGSTRCRCSSAPRSSALVLALPLALGHGPVDRPASALGRAGAPALWPAALIHALVYAGYVWLVGRAGAVFAAQVAYLVTGFGVLWAMLLLGERYSRWVWAALALMLAGLALVQPRADARRAGRRPAAKPSARLGPKDGRRCSDLPCRDARRRSPRWRSSP